MVIESEKTKALIGRAYGTALQHGFHEKDSSKEHLLMLVLSEIGEAVEADRRSRRAQMEMFDEWSRRPQPVGDEEKHWCFVFEKCIKDTLEDELADVVIRLYDICGKYNVMPTEDNVILHESFRAPNEGKTFCERCYYLCQILTDAYSLDHNELDEMIGFALSFVCFMCEEMHIDILKHIELKMRYNTTRPALHGKKY